MKVFKSILFALILKALVLSCGETHNPKPRGFFRIDLPEREYVVFDSVFPYKFEYSAHSNIQPDLSPASEPYWIDVFYKAFNAAIHISYKEISSSDDLLLFFEDSRTFANKQIPKATAIREGLVINPDERVYGLTYEIKGTGAASTYQFYLTDSINHFLRGALYFNFQPNNDSLAPVIDYIKEDIEHMIFTLRWNN